MAPLIGDAVRSCRADVLLVSLGLIDLGFYTNAEQTADNVRAFVAEARAARPKVRMAVMPVVRNIRVDADETFAGQVARFNTLLGETVADLDTAASRCCSSAAGDVRLPCGHLRRHAPQRERRAQDRGAFAEAMWQEWSLGGPYKPS